ARSVGCVASMLYETTRITRRVFDCNLTDNGLIMFFFFSSRRRHTRSKRDWSSDVCSSDLSNGNLYSLIFSSWIHVWTISLFREMNITSVFYMKIIRHIFALYYFKNNLFNFP